MNAIPQQAFYLSGNSLVHSSESEESMQEDPRGILWMYEEPRAGGDYVLGCDPSVGITGWSRALRTEGDRKTDNGAIVVLRRNALRELLLDKDGNPDIDPNTKQQRYVLQDLQVAEYAAPIDAVDIGRVANFVGRLYCGAEEAAELIFESYPGPGMLTLQELLRLQYPRLWHWEYFADNVAEQTSRIGWRSSYESQKVLWYRSRRHLMERRLVVRSKWLREEYSNAVIDLSKMRAKAAYGFHEDRMQAANMAMWAAHRWSYDDDFAQTPVSATAVFNPQTYAPVIGEERNFRDEWADVVSSW